MHTPIIHQQVLQALIQPKMFKQFHFLLFMEKICKNGPLQNSFWYGILKKKDQIAKKKRSKGDKKNK